MKRNSEISDDASQHVVKRHTRSASHGGGLIYFGNSPQVLTETPVPEPSRGHQRALSHGQVAVTKGHRREGSRTDFVLPEGHEERARDREQRPKKSSTIPSVGSWKRGHNRNHSRTDSVYSIRNQKVSRLRKFLRNLKKQEEKATRFIYPNHVPSKIHDNTMFPDNRICTRKYTILTFLPKNLFEQFHRYANLYFLFIVLLNFVPSINAFAKELAVTPLLFVLGVTAVKDAYEDHRRYLSDKLVNNTYCRVYCSESDRYVKQCWKDVHVGDIVHLSCDEMIPADIVLLNSSDENQICYIESSNLDGEITLKQRHCVKGLNEPGEKFEASKFDGQLEIGPPTTKIYHFVGSMRLRSGEKLSLSKENLILRDCVIKNTDFVEGIVVYAGTETKAMLNNGGPRYKRSRLEKRMNREVGLCVAILFAICLISATGSGFWQSQYIESGEVPFIPPSPKNGPTRSNVVEQSAAWVAFTSFWSFIIIYQVLIPISLYVTIEIIKLMQIYHIQRDEDFVDTKTNQTIKCRALNIPEELGQVQYLFADKTGTLTENDMIFRRCSVNGQDFGHESVENSSNAVNVTKIAVNKSLEELLHSIELHHIYTQKGTSQSSLTEESQRLHDFFFVLAACNTVVVSKRPHRDTLTASGMIKPPEDDTDETPRHVFSKHSRLRNLLSIPRLSPISSPVNTPQDTLKEPPRSPRIKGRGFRPMNGDKIIQEADEVSLKSFHNPDRLERPCTLELEEIRCPTPGPLVPKPFYEAESPDELALVEAAYTYGVQLLRRNLASVLVSMPGMGTTEYEMLHVLPFDSNRKRMSIIVRHPDTGQRILYCKGADSTVLSNLNTFCSTEEQKRIDMLQRHLGMYSRIGLRVLCMAKRVLTDRVYQTWHRDHIDAENALTNREKLLQNSYDEIEKNMSLLGATGIEDKLQDGVPETIEALRKAGIVVYVLTGDKQETAINIAFSCSLFSSDMQILKLCAGTKRETEEVLNRFLQQTQEEDRMSTLTSSNGGIGLTIPDVVITKKRGLVVDGRTLVFILDQRTNLKSSFLKLTGRCSAILCCRATPLQKALVVRLAKDKLKALCLAIGDGANDVSMIQTADVGVGICGVEGRQAVMASDYAISRFKHLQKLLLVHGHWCYERLAKTVLYFFYKNASFVFLLMFYQLYCGYSGSLMIEQMFLITFNLFFTSLPPMAVGIYNQDAPEDLLLKQPHLYSQGRLELVYGSYSFVINMADAFYQAAIIFFFSAYVYEHSDAGINEFGMTVTHTCLIAQLLHISIETNSWTLIFVASLVISYLAFLCFCLLYTVACNGCLGIPSMVGEFTNTVSTSKHWFVLVVSCIAALTPRVTVRTLQSSLKPSDVTKAMLQRKRNEEFEMLNESAGVYRFKNMGDASNESYDAANSLVTMTSVLSADDDL